MSLMSLKLVRTRRLVRRLVGGLVRNFVRSLVGGTCGETCRDWKTCPWVFLFFRRTDSFRHVYEKVLFFKICCEYNLLCYWKRILWYIRKIRYSVKVKVHFRYYHKREKYRCRMKEILQQKFFKKKTSIIQTCILIEKREAKYMRHIRECFHSKLKFF